MPTVRELLTKFSFQVDDGPLTNMKSALRSVGADLRKTFDTTTIRDHEKGLERVAGAAKGVGTSFSKVGETALLLGGAVTALGAGLTAAFAGVKSTANYADAIKDTSDQLGIASGELQALGYVAQLSGSSTEELGVSLRFLSKNAVEAADNATGPAASAFKKLGVTVKDSNGQFKSSTLLMEELADGFKNLPEGPERTALAMDLLGRSGAGMVPLLSQGSDALRGMKKEAYDLGAVMSDDALAAGANFNDEMDRLTAVINGVKNTVGSALIPVFTEWVTVIRDLIVANKDVIATRLETAVRFLADAMTIAYRIARTFYENVKALADLFGGLENVLKWVGIALLALGGMGILSAIGTLAVSIGGLVAAVLSLNAAAISAAISMAIGWLVAAAIPILIGAAIVALIVIIEDMWTAFQGGESYFATFAAFLNGWMNDIADWAFNVGEKIYDAIVQPIVDGFGYIQGLLKDVGIDPSKWNIDKAMPKSSGSYATQLQNGATFDEGYAKFGDFSKPTIAPTPMVLASAANPASNVSVQNSITVEANGLNEEQATRVATAAAAASQADLFKRAAQNSVRKHRE